MKSKKEVEKIEINIPNRVFYSFLFLISIILFGVGVYAYGGTNPSVMGHSIGELAPPGGAGVMMFSSGSWVYTTNLPPTCTGDSQTVRYDSATRTWGCGTVGYECSWTGWSPYFYQFITAGQDCYYIDSCYVESDCSTQLCEYRLDGIAMDPPLSWDAYATPVQQIECIGGEVTQMRFVSVCPTDATSACGYVDTSG